METGSAQAGLCNGLSRMKGNFHVRFLGEGVAAMPLPYPTRKEIGRTGPKAQAQDERGRQSENRCGSEGALEKGQSPRQEIAEGLVEIRPLCGERRMRQFPGYGLP